MLGAVVVGGVSFAVINITVRSFSSNQRTKKIMFYLFSIDLFNRPLLAGLPVSGLNDNSKTSLPQLLPKGVDLLKQ